MSEAPLLTEIAEQAERIRADGSLPSGFEERAAELFAEVASDPARLEEELVALRQAPPNEALPAPAVPLPKQLSRVPRRLLGRLRRLLGPSLRQVERKALARATRLGQAGSAQAMVLGEKSRRLAGRFGPSAVLLSRLGPESDAAGELPLAPGLRMSSDGALADPLLDTYLAAALADLPPGEILLVEGAECSIEPRLSALGLEARTPAGLGPLESLAAAGPSSLAAAVFAGSSLLGGAGAEGLAHLAAGRLAPRGMIVVLSESPGWRAAIDPIGSDMAPSQPVHAVTWRYLFACCGLEGSSFAESGEASAYAVSARRPS